MNKVFKIVWNSTIGQWVVTSELGKSHQKSKSSARAKSVVAAGLIAIAGMSSAIAEEEKTYTHTSVDGFAHSKDKVKSGDLGSVEHS